MRDFKKWLEPFSSAWIGVISHRLRSFLTILGIVIGVAAVIALMSIGRGAQAEILSRIETLGSDLIFVRPGASVGFGGIRGASGSANTLTMEDATAIAEQVSYVSSVAPIYSRNLQLIAGSQNMNTSVTGTTSAYKETYNLDIASGSFFSDYDYERGAKVAVLGSEVAQTLFEGVDPIGQSVRMENIIVHVIGVLESKGAMWGSPDDMVLIPMMAMQQTVAQSRNARGERLISSISLNVSDEGKADMVVEDITSLLRLRHQLGSNAENDFNITSMEEVAGTISETSETMTIFLGAIAAIALFVGGIGVMNIMLVSVLERTREIGIRKALGAQERDIWIQFLLESAFLSFAGGIIGVIVGWIIAFVVSRMGLMTTLVSADIVILAVSVSIAIGVFFGFYPAWNASRLNPIDALRYE
jgi:putative ABC transport system permease protein